MTPKENIKYCIQLTIDNISIKDTFLDINGIALDDKKTLQLFKESTKQIFNTSHNMVKYCKQIKNLTFDDLVNISSLEIPGRGELMKEYISRRNKTKRTIYLHPLLKPILNHTQGLILFHEQFIEIFKQIGSLSYGEAMALMNHFGTKGKNEIPLELKFIKNAQKNGLSYIKTIDLLVLINQSLISVPRLYHFTEHTLLSYQTAYLKTYYKEEYLNVIEKWFPGLYKR